MKKMVIAIIACVGLLTTCATSKQDGGSQVVQLDQVIREVAEHLENSLETSTVVALLNFSSPSVDFSAYMLDELSDRLVNGGKVVVVDRAELDLIRREANFQLSGEVSDETAVSIGQKIGAQIIISGSLTSIGRNYRIRIRALSVETAIIIAARSNDISSREERVVALLAGRTPVAENITPIIQIPTWRSPSLGTIMIRIEGGSFEMGSGNEWFGVMPVGRRTISSFYMGKFPITQREWTEIMGTNPSEFIGDNLPVTNVSWYDAIKFCNALSIRDGLTPVYIINKETLDEFNRIETDNLKWTVRLNRRANGYRLPTNSEWEFAARGGDGSPGGYRYSGSNNIDEVAWNPSNAGWSIQEVGGLKPNILGLYDMTGNVQEWCWDWVIFDEWARNRTSFDGMNVLIDPIGPVLSGDGRTLRGGCAFGGHGGLNAWHNTVRNFSCPTHRSGSIGFRIARNL